MKRDAWTLICLGLLSVALLAVLALLRNGEATGQVAPEESAVNRLPEAYAMTAPIRSIRISQAGRPDFTLLNLAETPADNISSALAGREELPVDILRINGILRAAQSLSYIELLFESLEDTAPFGLESPRATVEITDMNGESVTLLIGDTAPGNIGVYLKLLGRASIYLVPVYMLDAYLLPEADFLSHTITPVSADMDFSSVTLGGRVREKWGEITIIPADMPGAFRLCAPVEHGLDQSAGVMALRMLFGAQAERVEAIYPSGADISALGLDNPYALAKVSGGAQGGFSLRVSEPDNIGRVYLMRDGIPLLYSARAEDLPWLDMQFYDLMDKTAHAPELDELSELLIETREGSWSFEVSRGDEGMSVSLAGDRLDADIFGEFYLSLISAELSEPAMESALPPEAVFELIIAVTYRYREGETHTVAFYEGPPRRCYIRVDNGEYYLTPSLYAESLLEDMRAITG